MWLVENTGSGSRARTAAALGAVVGAGAVAFVGLVGEDSDEEEGHDGEDEVGDLHGGGVVVREVWWLCDGLVVL